MLKRALLLFVFLAACVTAIEPASQEKLDSEAHFNTAAVMRLSGQGPPPSAACMPGGANWPCPPTQPGAPVATNFMAPTPAQTTAAQSTQTNVQVKPSVFRAKGKLCTGLGGLVELKYDYTKSCALAHKPKYRFRTIDRKSADGSLVTTPDWSSEQDNVPQDPAAFRECDHILEAVFFKRRLLADLAEHMRRTDPTTFPGTDKADQRICDTIRPSTNLDLVREAFNGAGNMFGVPRSVNQFKAGMLAAIASGKKLEWIHTKTSDFHWNRNKAAPGIIQYDSLHHGDLLAMADTMQQMILQLLSQGGSPYSVRSYPTDAWRKITDTDYSLMISYLKGNASDVEDVVKKNCDTNPNGSTKLYPPDKKTGCCDPESLAKKEFKPSDQWYQRPVPVPGKRKCNGDPCDITKQCCLKADGMTLKTDPDVPSLDPSSAPHRRQLLNRPILAGRQSVPMPGAPDESCQKSDKEPEDDNSKPDLEGPAPLAALVGAPAVVAAVAAWMNPLWLLVAAAATAAEARKDHQKEIDDNLASFAALAADKDHQDDCRLALDQLQRILKQMRYEPTPAPSCGGAAVTAIASAPAPTSLTPQQIYSMGVAAITNDPLAYTATHSASSPVNGASTSTITSTPLPTVSHPTPAEIYSQGVAAIKGNSTTAAMTTTAMPSPNATAAAPLAVIHSRAWTSARVLKITSSQH